MILEGAPKPYRAGNSRHTRNFRCMHDGPLSALVGSYGDDEYYDDLIKVTDGKTDAVLARLVIRSSEECLPWMEARGVRFQPPLSGTLSLARTNAFSWAAAKRWSRLIGLKMQSQPSPQVARVRGDEFGFILLLFLVSASGLVLYAFGATPALEVLLALHLGTVLAFFLLTPYSKMAHGLYRLAALVRDAQVKRNSGPLQQANLKERVASV